MVTTSDGKPTMVMTSPLKRPAARTDADGGKHAEQHDVGGVPGPHEADHAQAHDRGE